MNTWIEITNDAGEVEAVCTLAEFLAANECFGDEQVAELNALTHLDAERLNAVLALAFDTLEAQREDGEWHFGGGAVPEGAVKVCAPKRAAALDMIASLCASKGGGAIEVQVCCDADEAPMPFSIWENGDILGAGETLDEAIAEALADVHAWNRGPSEHDSSVRILPSGEVGL